ncbi:hypothetical protein D3C75_1014890 [compost metagenome]
MLQLPPDQAEALIERLPARVGGQQAGLGPQVAGQRFDLRPGIWRGVQVLDRFEVAVQVQYHVGIASQALQDQALGLQRRARGVRVQPPAQVFADQRKVVCRIIGQVFFDLVADGV